jgi:hypothetical protein
MKAEITTREAVMDDGFDLGYDSTEHQKKIEEKYAKDLSVGKYVEKNVGGTFISLGTAVAGYFAGGALAKAFHQAEKPALNFLGSAIPRAAAFKWGAAYAGAMLGSMASFYSIWKKKEAAQLAVQEMNADIAGMTAIRSKTDPDLVKEMDSLRGRYDELKAENEQLKQHGSHAAKIEVERAHAHGESHAHAHKKDAVKDIVARGEKSHADHAHAHEADAQPAMG